MGTKFVRYGSWLVLALIGLDSARAQDQMFILKVGADTVSIERFTRTANRLDAELLIKLPQAIRFKLGVDLDPNKNVTRFTNAYWFGADPTDAPARQSAVFTFSGDTAIVEISDPNTKRTERVATNAAAIPYINPSFSLIELMLQRIPVPGPEGASVPLLMVSSGQTMPAVIKRIGTDSLEIVVATSSMRFKVDAKGNILGGVLPGQNAVLIRTGTDPAAFKSEKPDYSAPAGAPYRAVEVMVPTPMGHKLAGTLTLPRGASKSAPVPAVVTITGSGGQDRDEWIPMFKGFRLFREFADSLGRRGIAVLRMDDRGIGGSGGDPMTATTPDFVEDIRAGLAYLRTMPEIDGRRLGLLGHSEGGVIAPMVAAKDSSLAGIVLLAGTAYTGRQVLTFQYNNLILRDTSLSPAKRDSLLATVAAQVDSTLGSAPWFKFFDSYDPAATARKVRTPVLILNGAQDQQVTPDQAPLLERAFKDAGNRDVTMKVLPNLNHLFVYDPDGFPGGYTQLKSFAVDRPTIGLVVDWLVIRLAKPAT